MDKFKQISDNIVACVMQKDKGKIYSVDSWKVVDFLKEGDNYICFVTSIEVNFKDDDNKDETTSYVVKFNPKRDSTAWTSSMLFIFKHEIDFLQKIGPDLNEYLLNIKHINIPKCFYSTLEKDEEMFITNDLRNDGYRMFDRKNSYDMSHLLLVIDELAKINATGYLSIRKNSLEGVMTMYPSLAEGTYSNDTLKEFGEMIKQIIESQMDLALKLLENSPEFKNVSSWIKDNRSNVIKIIIEHITNKSDKFYTICHGDCWNNNILFK